MSGRFRRGDWVEHPRYGVGRFVRGADDAPQYDWAAVAFARSTWTPDLPDEEQKAAEWTLAGVTASELQPVVKS